MDISRKLGIGSHPRFNRESIAIIASLLIFLVAGTLDWADGTLASSTGQATFIGAQFDPMAGRVKQVAFVSTVNVICFYSTSSSTYLLIGVLSAILILILGTIPSPVDVEQGSSSLSSQREHPYRKYPLLKFLLAFIFYDGRARYTDTTILLILLLIYANFSLVLFVLFVWVATFLIAAIYMVWRVAES